MTSASLNWRNKVLKIAKLEILNIKFKIIILEDALHFQLLKTCRY